MHAILDVCPDTFVGLRNRALIVVMWRAGLRLAEALSLMVYDIDRTNRTARVRHGKGDRARTVGLDGRTVGAVTMWMNERGQAKLRYDSPLFCTRRGGEMDQSYVRQLLPRLAREAGVQKRVHAHGFRHTFAVELAREGVPVPFISRLLGHSSLATTSIYLASLSPEEALNAVRKREW